MSVIDPAADAEKYLRAYCNAPRPGSGGTTDKTPDELKALKKRIHSNPDAAPIPPRVNVHGIPEQLRAMPRWACWRYWWDEKREEWTKRPVTTANRWGSHSRPDQWGTFDAAFAFYQRNQKAADGMGFLFVAGDGVFGTDRDGIRDPETGLFLPGIPDEIAELPSYTEVSPSWTGVKTYCLGTLPGDECRKDDDRGIELYSKTRFFTVTGLRIGDVHDLVDCTAGAANLVTRLWPPKRKRPAPSGPPTPVTDDDTAILAKIRTGKQAAKFDALWRGDLAAVGGDESKADFRLCCALAFWTQKDAARMDRLFRQSGLMRPKWDERHYVTGETYGQRTIANAIEITDQVYDPRRPRIVWRWQDMTSPPVVGGDIPRVTVTTEDIDVVSTGDPEPAADTPTPPPDDAPPGDGDDGDDDSRHVGGRSADHEEPTAATESDGPPPGGDGGGEGEGRSSAADRLVGYVAASVTCLFHNPDNTAYAEINRNGHREVYPVRSKAFKLWMTELFLNIDGKAANSETLTTATNTVEAVAMFRGGERPVHLRVAPHPAAGVVIDLCDPEWRVVVITAGGWEVTADSPVTFQRGRSMRPLPTPQREGDFSRLREFINLKTDDDWLLLTAWATAAILPTGPYTLAHLKGEQGAAKTTAGEFVRAVVDPHETPLRREPKEVRDLAIASRGGWAIMYDNLSSIPTWLSDALCCVATGGGFGTRELYTNDEETVFSFMRPSMLTSIGDVIGQPDMLDRSLPLELVQIPDENRCEKEVLKGRFEAARPGIIGGLYTIVSKSLALLPVVRAEKRPLPRMADFAQWGEAVARSLGHPPGHFVDILFRLRAVQDQAALEESPVAVAVTRFARDRREWCGTATNLMEALCPYVSEHDRRERRWPKSPNALSSRLREIAPALRRVGVEIAKGEDTRTKSHRVIRITYRPESSRKPSSPSSPNDATANESKDLRGDGPTEAGPSPTVTIVTDFHPEDGRQEVEPVTMVTVGDGQESVPSSPLNPLYGNGFEETGDDGDDADPAITGDVYGDEEVQF